MGIINEINKAITGECGCGKYHAEIKLDVETGSGVIVKVPEYVKKYGCRNVFLIADSNTYAVAFSYAEASRKCDFSFKTVLLNCILKKLHDVRRAFQVTGAAYADLYYHNFALTSFSKKSVTVSGVTEKNASSTVTHTPC